MTTSELTIPELSLVVMVGASSSGKSTFARSKFLPTEVLSSDYCRALVDDDENSLDATNDAFDVLHYIARKRLKRNKLTVVDATNVQRDARLPLVKLARECDCLPVAIVLNLPKETLLERHKSRPDRDFSPGIVLNQMRQAKRSIKALKREGFRYVHVLNSVEEMDAAVISRIKLWNNKQDEHGPFDIIGDVHGCLDELQELLEQLGYRKDVNGYSHAEGRKAVFVGDLTDRGPNSLGVVDLVMKMVDAGNGFCVAGNHDSKAARKLAGRNVQVTHGLERTVAEIEQLPEEEQAERTEELRSFLDKLVGHYVFDNRRLVVAHAGMKEEYQGRASRRAREFGLYGETTGETDEFGLPVRLNWAADYRGQAVVVYGHTPVPEAEWLNKTINIDTGCVFGGKLTSLRYPELELVSVPAKQIYYEPVKPFIESDAPRSAQHISDDVLDIDDVIGKRVISTRLRPNITIREENSLAALEVMSRFAVNPKWLIYLPPTMSPSETSEKPGMLEHPAEAFNHFLNRGVAKVVCQQKHMGSRAVVMLCRSTEVAQDRFGISGDSIGVCYTRTGRPFFDPKSDLESQLLLAVREAFDKAGAWDSLNSDWVCLDCELMPWSMKAMDLIKKQYAAVGASSNAALNGVVHTLEEGVKEQPVLDELLNTFTERKGYAEDFVHAYRPYCWAVDDFSKIKLAPFHIMATEGKTHADKTHKWHMDTLAAICEQSELLLATPYREVDLTDEESKDAATAWWTELTASGGEGMVVKPLDFISRGPKGLIQPALKCRGVEYLRIIYGMEYTTDENLAALRNRSLGKKRSLAMREFSLGIEALERFCRKEPLRRVHECVFGVLALESEPVDPRL